ncbi:hypothetical protein NliqN6_0094 [Naganishia liquefaciens]|uniref:Uncharacterized protein n=1 Tax=Naganishia liquefaciens TaxID=104408 RepID=A0A8H3TMB9_9TREE|nr:hypothetical protein NliqN6_0094 [Naganishia liquefaciens]
MSTTSSSIPNSPSAVSSVTSNVSTPIPATPSQASSSTRPASSASSGSASLTSTSAATSRAETSSSSASVSASRPMSTTSSSAVSSSVVSSSAASSSMASSSSQTLQATTAPASITAGSVISSSNDGTAASTNHGLSAGAIGGIVGGVVGVLALCVLAWLLIRWKRRRRDVERYPIPPPRPDMVFSGKPVADKEERPTISKSRGHESFNSLYAPSLPSYYPNYNRPISIPSGLNADSWTPPQPQYMANTASTPSTPTRSLQPMSSQSSMALTNAVNASGRAPQLEQNRPMPAPIQTTGLAPPASVDIGTHSISRRSSRSTMMFPQVSHSPSMASMHSNGFNNTPHGGRRITLTMPTPLDPNTAPDGYLVNSRTNSVSEFGQYTTSMYGSSPRRTRDSRRSLQPYHQGHLSPHTPSAVSEFTGMTPVSLHQHHGSISTITVPSSGPSRNGSGSAGSTSGGATSDSEALMIKSAKGKQVDRTS